MRLFDGSVEWVGGSDSRQPQRQVAGGVGAPIDMKAVPRLSAANQVLIACDVGRPNSVMRLSMAHASRASTDLPAAPRASTPAVEPADPNSAINMSLKSRFADTLS